MTDHPPIFTPLIGPSPQANPGDADMADILVLADDRLSYYRLIAMPSKLIRMLGLFRVPVEVRGYVE
jgi:hypothetical protein